MRWLFIESPCGADHSINRIGALLRWKAIRLPVRLVAEKPPLAGGNESASNPVFERLIC
jgi:hypothetical protein